MADIRMTVVGSYQSTIKAIASGKLKPDTYIYLKDKEILAWVDYDGVLHLLGDSVQQVTDLPEKGSQTVLYIKGTTPYIWNGTEYVNLLQDLYTKIGVINEQLDGLIDPETGKPIKVTEYVEISKEETMTYTDEKVAPVQTQVEELKESLGTINVVI